MLAIKDNFHADRREGVVRKEYTFSVVSDDSGATCVRKAPAWQPRTNNAAARQREKPPSRQAQPLRAEFAKRDALRFFSRLRPKLSHVSLALIPFSPRIIRDL